MNNKFILFYKLIINGRQSLNQSKFGILIRVLQHLCSYEQCDKKSTVETHVVFLA